MSKKIGWIGLGRMGEAMVTKLLKAGHPVQVWNRTASKAAHLAEAFHLNYEIHHGGNSLNNVANLHVIMAIKNCEFFEVLLPAGMVCPVRFCAT